MLFDPFRVGHDWGRGSVGWHPRLFTSIRSADGQERRRERRVASNRECSRRSRRSGLKGKDMLPEAEIFSILQSFADYVPVLE